jgi:hypothetical protein
MCPAPGGKLVGEERDVDKKRVSFFCLSLSLGTPLWKGQDFGEPWWIGIDAVYRDVLVLHRFTSPDLPEPRGITVADLESGRVLWENPDYVFVGVLQGNLVARLSARGSQRFALVNRLSGHEEEKGEAVVGPPPAEREAWEEEWVFPVELPRGDPLQDVVSKAGAVDEVPLSSIAVGHLIVVGYHVRTADSRSEPFYRSRIALVDSNTGRINQEITLDEKVQRPMPDTFLVRGNVLYCIREHRTLAAIPLSE